MKINYDKLVKEWSDRMSGRAPIYTNRYHRTVLRDVMKDFGYSLELIDGVQPIFIPNVILNEGSNQDASLNTAMMETAALIGTTGVSQQPFIDLLESPKVFKKIKITKKDDINDFKKQCKSIIDLCDKAKKELLKGLGKAGDWNSAGVGLIKGFTLPELKMEDGVPNFYENNLQDIAVAGGLAWGMLVFVAEKVSFKPNFIHDKIMDFYKAEVNRGITRKGAKTATPDAILSNVDASTLLKALKDDTNEIVGNESDGTVKLGDKIIYMQASLKKGVGSSQIGKFSKKLRGTYSLGMSNKEASNYLLSHYEPNEIEQMIYEGLWDKVKSFTSSIFTKAKNLVNSGLSKLKGFFSKSFNDGATIKAKTINKLTSGYTIKEWTEDDVNLLMEGDMNAPTRATVKAIYNSPAKAYSNLAKEVGVVKKKLNNIGDLGYGVIKELGKLKKIPAVKGDKEPGTKVVFNLIANMATLEMVGDLTSKSSKLKKIIADLITEMLFGATNQPLWKVYGKMETGDKAYSYLGTAETVEKRFDGDDINIELIGIDIHPQSEQNPKNVYYVITCYLLQEIAEAGKFYVKVRTGTNSSSRITQNYEGQAIIGAFDIDKKLKDII